LLFQATVAEPTCPGQVGMGLAGCRMNLTPP